MPALSYNQRFCDYVKEGSKTQTIRAFRKRPFKIGDQLSHFYAMRTKQCTRLIPGTTTCIDVKTVYILKDGNVFIGPAESENFAALNLMILHDPEGGAVIVPKKLNRLSETDKNILAWADGFRQNNDPAKRNTDCWKLMFDWWKETHALPFCGQIIYWNKPVGNTVENPVGNTVENP